MKEKAIETPLVQRCLFHGWLCFKTEHVWLGFPDRTVLAPGGRAAFVETKRPGDRVARKRQKHVHRVLRNFGFEVYLCYDEQTLEAFFLKFSERSADKEPRRTTDSA